MENKVRDGMQSLRSYMDRAGLHYNIQSFGCSYFKNVEPVYFTGACCVFGTDPASCRNRQKVEDYIKKSVKYEIFRRSSRPGYQVLFIAPCADLAACRLYQSFVNRSVAAWEAAVHTQRMTGIYNPAAEGALASEIMKYWETEYKRALAASRAVAV